MTVTGAEDVHLEGEHPVSRFLAVESPGANLLETNSLLLDPK